MSLPVDVSLFATLFLLAADNIPTFNVEPHCNMIAKRTGVAQDLEVCLQQERTAKQQLAMQWTEFTPAEKFQCLQLSTLGGDPIYTELLTCLELARDARQLRERNAAR